MVDEGFNHRFPFSSNLNPNLRFSRGVPCADDLDPEDDLFDSWLRNGEDTTHISNDQTENANEELLMNEIVRDVKVPSAPNLSGDASARDLVPEEEAQGPTGSSVVEIGGSRDENMVDLEQLNVSASGVGLSGGYQIPVDGVALLPNASAANRMPLEKDVTSFDIADSRKHSFVSGGASPSTSKGKGLTLSSDSDSDSLPDIVDGDPDSD